MHFCFQGMKRSRSQHWCYHHLPNHRCRLSCFSLLCYFCFLSLTSFKQTINWFNLEHPNCQTNLCVFRLLSLQYPDGKVCSLSLTLRKCKLKNTCSFTYYAITIWTKKYNNIYLYHVIPIVYTNSFDYFTIATYILVGKLQHWNAVFK